MARIRNISKNLNAFLDMIAWCEGTTTHKLTQNDGYDVIVTGVSGVEIFTDYKDHPFMNGRKSVIVNSKGLSSSASGRYQIMLEDWPYYKKKLDLKDFSPVSQDEYAINQLHERNSITAIEDGNIPLAIARCSNIWASLPGANYKDQAMRSLENCISVFIAKGGTCSVLPQSSQVSAQSSSQSSAPISAEKPKLNPQPEPSKPVSMLQGLFKAITQLLKRK